MCPPVRTVLAKHHHPQSLWVSTVFSRNNADFCWSPNWMQTKASSKEVKNATVMPEVCLKELIWCSSSGSPRSAGRSAGLGPPPGWSSPPPPPRWCHTARSGGVAPVARPCRRKPWPGTEGTPPSPKAADGQGVCPCWSPWLICSLKCEDDELETVKLWSRCSSRCRYLISCLLCFGRDDAKKEK